MAHGEFDTVVIPERAQTSCNLLEKMGYQVSWNEYPMEHSVNREELADISRYLQGALGTAI
jgi:phospholipase/carboxylesterase